MQTVSLTFSVYVQHLERVIQEKKMHVCEVALLGITCAFTIALHKRSPLTPPFQLQEQVVGVGACGPAFVHNICAQPIVHAIVGWRKKGTSGTS
jgi:hypothetical protein